MPVLVHEVEDYAHAWTNFQPGMASEQHLECPQNPMWWINLAEKHNRIDLAGEYLSWVVMQAGAGRGGVGVGWGGGSGLWG